MYEFWGPNISFKIFLVIWALCMQSEFNFTLHFLVKGTWNYWWVLIQCFACLFKSVHFTYPWSVKFSALTPVPRTFNLELLLGLQISSVTSSRRHWHKLGGMCSGPPIFIGYTLLFCRYLLESVLDGDFCLLLWSLFCVFQAWPWWKIVTWQYAGLITCAFLKI